MTLYDKLKPEIKDKLDAQANKYCTIEYIYNKLKREPFFLHNPKEGLIDTEILKEMAIHFKQKKNITRAMVVFEYIKHIESVDKYKI